MTKTIKAKENETTEKVSILGKVNLLVQLWVTIACAISVYILVFIVKSDQRTILAVVSTGPLLVSLKLLYSNWLKR
jgi:hypothetical protein